MKKILILLFSVISLTVMSQDAFDKGWESGYIDACMEAGNGLCAAPPAPFYNGESPYTAGYTQGYARGMKDAKEEEEQWNKTIKKVNNAGNSNQSRNRSQQSSSNSGDSWNETSKIIFDKMKQQREDNMGWEQINNNRWTYTYVGSTGLIGLKKLKKKALKEVEDQSIIQGFDYEIIKIMEYKTKLGVLPKVIVIIEIN